MIEQTTIDMLVNEFKHKICIWDMYGELNSNLSKIGISIPYQHNSERVTYKRPDGRIAVLGASEVQENKIIAALCEQFNIPKQTLQSRVYFNLDYYVFHEENVENFLVDKWGAIIIGPNDHKNKNTAGYKSVVHRLKANKDCIFPYVIDLDMKKAMSKTSIVNAFVKLVDEGIIEF